MLLILLWKILPANKFFQEKSHFLTKLLCFLTYEITCPILGGLFLFGIPFYDHILLSFFFRFPNEVFLKKHLTVCIQKQADNAGDKTSRSSKVTNEPKELFIEGDIKDEPLDISENIDAVTGEFITGDIWKRFIASKLFYLPTQKLYNYLFFFAWNWHIVYSTYLQIVGFLLYYRLVILSWI